MLAWLTEKFARTDDSLASEAGIRAFLESLPMSAPALALADIGERFANAAELDLEPGACRHALLRLDEAAQGPVERAWNNLFDQNPGNSVVEAHWQTLVTYQRNVFCGFAYCLEQLSAPDQLNATERKDAHILAARAMAALVSHKILMRIRYRDPHPAFWSDAHALLSRAVRFGVGTAPVKLYPGLLHQTTVEREYLAGLLLDVAPTGNLLPAQTYCLHLVLQHFSEHFRFSDTFGTHAPFFIDPAKGKPPQRWLVGLKPRPGVRFFGFVDACKHLGALRKAAQTSSRPPEWLVQSGIDTDRYQGLLVMLLEYWSDNPPQRRNRRDREVAAILVTHGVSQVHRMLAYSKFAKEGRQINYAENSGHDPLVFKALRFGSVGETTPAAATASPLAPMEVLKTFELAGDRAMAERWSVADTSEGGLGAVAEQHRGWLRAGMLIGFRYHDDIDWRVATVRRVGRTPQGKLGVGLKIQPGIAGYARLRLNKSDENNVWIAAGTGVDPYSDAILIGGEQPSLIVAPGTFSAGRECAMNIEKSTQNIRFEQLLERGVDFERIAISRIAAT